MSIIYIFNPLRSSKNHKKKNINIKSSDFKRIFCYRFQWFRRILGFMHLFWIH